MKIKLRKWQLLCCLFILPCFLNAQNACLDFDGEDDFVTINSSVLDNIGTCDFTIEAWIQPNNLSTNIYALLSNRTAVAGNGVLVFIHPPWGGSATSMLAVQIGGGNYFILNNGNYNGNLIDNECKHIGIVRDKNVFSFYINGSLIGTKIINTSSVYPTISTGGDMKIGYDNISAVPYRGGISELKIWSTARSADQVMQDMNESLPLNKEDLNGYWRMNEGSGQTLSDYTDFGNTAVLGSDNGVQANDPLFNLDCCNDFPINDCATVIQHDENTILGNETYNASLYVKSNATVQANETVEYLGGEFIELDAGFTAEGEFYAAIEACDDTDSYLLNLASPSNHSFIQSSDITFEWELESSQNSTIPQNINYQLTILEVGNALNVTEAVANNIVSFNDNFTLGKSTFQQKTYAPINLDNNKTYLWRVSFDDLTGVYIESQWFYFDYFEFPFPLAANPCDSNCPILRNNNFNNNPQNHWIDEGNEAPIFETTLAGCHDDGFVTMTTTGTAHSIISQTALNTLTQGDFYQLGMCIRMDNPLTSSLKIKAFAFNGNPTSFEVGPDVALIGTSGEIPSSNGDWVQFEFPIWEANKDFTKIALMVEKEQTGPFTFTETLDIDNVCISEVEERFETPEYGFTFDSCANVIYPDWLNDLIDNQGVVVSDTEVEYKRGGVVDLYDHKYDLSTDLWYTEGAPFDHSVGGGPTDFGKYDSLYNSLDSSGVLYAALSDDINDFIDPLVASLDFNDALQNSSVVPINPVVPENFECLHFDGIDDKVRVNSTQQFNAINTTDFTLEMTFNADAVQNVASPVLFSNYRQTIGGPFPLDTHDGIKVLLYENLTISPYKMLALQKINFLGQGSIPIPPSTYYIPDNGTAGDLLDGRCHSIAITKAGTVLTFYIDGASVGSFSTNLDSYLNIASPRLPIIGNDTETSNPFAGSISDFRLWRKARTAPEIASNSLRKRFSPTESDLLINFELLDVRTQTFYSNASPTLSATLGTNDQASTDDPTTQICSNNCSFISYGTICPFGAVNSKPFGGRDIVYVHGLNLDHVFGPFASPAEFVGTWPTDKQKFYTGEFGDRAAMTWEQHVQKELGSINNPTNNYLTISYPCAQRLSVGINAVVTQIKDAMETGRGVVWADPIQDCRQSFGREIVIVSHSTGGLLTSTLLGLGAMSDPSSSSYDPAVQNSQGNFKSITDNVKAHVALNGAMSGSPLARAALFVVAYVNTNHPGVVAGYNLFSEMTGLSIAAVSAALNPAWVYNSVLVDLEPVVSNFWGNKTYGNATCSTVTGATTFSGIPNNRIGLEAIVAKTIIRGTDDGVLMMDCQCGRKKTIPYTIPSTFVARPNITRRNFDMGNPFLLKSANLYTEMKNGFPLVPSLLLGNSCTSGKTTTGMLTWLLRQSNHPRWDNHYSFMQGSAYHYEAWDANENGADYYNGYFSGPTSYEESLGITDANIYDIVPGTGTPLVNSSIRNKEDEIIRKRTIGFHFFGRYFEIIIWKRTYHLMNDYENQDLVSYIYDHVLKQ